MINVDIYFLQCIVGMVFLVTIELFLIELKRRPAQTFRPGWAWCLAFLRWPVIAYLLVLTSMVLGLPYGYVPVLIMTVMVIQIYWMRQSEDRQLLQWLTCAVVSTGNSAPDAFEKFAGNRSTSLSQRCRAFAHYLRQGATPIHAAKASRLPLSVGSLMLLEDGPVACADSSPSVSDAEGLIRETESKTWALTVQLIYLGGLAVAMTVVTFIYLFLVPTFDRMIDDFGLKPNRSFQLFKEFQYYLPLLIMAVAVLLITYLILILLCSLWPSPWLLRITPWFGYWTRTRGQVNALQDLASGVRSGRSLEEAVGETEFKTRSRWVRSRCHTAHRYLSAGQSPAIALHASGLVSQEESQWIRTAALSGNLSTALDALAQNSCRRFELLWQVRFSWMIPATVLLLGAAVLFIFYAILGTLTNFIGYLA